MKNIEQKILSGEAKAFLLSLHKQFETKRQALLQERVKRQKDLLAYPSLNFLPETKSVREANWQVAATPKDLNDRRVEITGPAEPKMIINALNSAAKVFMADFEDSLAPVWSKLLEGQFALQQAVRKDLQVAGENGKSYQLNPAHTTTLVVRPRGWHLPEAHFLAEEGVAISASLFDFGLYFFHNAKELLAKGSGPYFYLPKMESHKEARLWNEVFIFAQNYLQIPQGTIRATVLIETIPAAFEMEEILFELKDHAAGLNAGRWDYIFSLIKKFHQSQSHILPDRAQVTMATNFMSAYSHLLVQTCHKRGAHAIGGMSAFIPNRKEPELTEKALLKVAEDKAREAMIGFDGTWVAHPDLIPTAEKELSAKLGSEPHQKKKVPTNVITAVELLNTRVEHGTITEAGIRSNINVALLYLDRWLSGTGAAALYNLMEDAATAEISRSQVWQCLHHKVSFGGTENFSAKLFKLWLQEESEKIEKAFSTSHLPLAKQFLSSLVLSENFTDFLTLSCYEALNKIHDTSV